MRELTPRGPKAQTCFTTTAEGGVVEGQSHNEDVSTSKSGTARNLGSAVTGRTCTRLLDKGLTDRTFWRDSSVV